MFFQKHFLLTASIASALLVSCGGDNDSSSNNKNTGDQSDSYTSVTIYASSYSDYTYYDLDSATVVTSSDDWDIAVKRTGFMLNSNKASAMADVQSEKYDEADDPIANAIVNATASTEEGDFLAATTVIGDFIGSDVVPAINTTDLYTYNGILDPTDHGFSPKDENFYFLTSAEGDSYAKMNVSAFNKSRM